MDKLKIHRALISVTDKKNLNKIVSVLFDQGVEIISTGGTKKYIEELNIPVTSIEKITGNPEAFGGRMKSISFQVGSALLFRRNNEEDLVHAKELGIKGIDLVICNLYPFVECVKRGDADEEELIENIDIGGPLMLRAAAKNFYAVTVLSDITDYDDFLQNFQEGKCDLSFRKKMAAKTFSRIAAYDIAIAEELGSRFNEKENISWLSLNENEKLRYGENPHQKSNLYFFKNTENTIALAKSQFIQGKELSYNNWMDADSAWRSMSDIAHLFPNQCVVSIIKHANPCGLATAEDGLSALKLAWSTDTVSSFGGILAFSQKVNKEIIEFLNDRFIEVIIAPDYSDDALNLLQKKKNVRVLKSPIRPKVENELMIRSISGGLLLQNEDESMGQLENLEIKTKKNFNQSCLELAQFGILVSKHLKSNSIALVGKSAEGNLTLVGTGMGQPNRLDSLKRLAAPRAVENGYNLEDLLLVSDAFFPFRDSIEVCHEIGIKHIVQPGGSIRDQEVIDACNEFQIAMAFTGRRHFRH